MEYDKELADVYWRDNMVSSVLFSHAVESAVADKGSVGHVVELGPHPALKGPVQQTIQESTGESLPYSGTLIRGQNAAETFSDALGFIWAHASDNSVNFQNSYQGIATGSRPIVLKGLPAYAWDHDQIFWSESRIALAMRTRENKPHDLLGNLLPDGSEQELRWRNMIRPKEIPWLSGHQLQGQVVFPAAGYISMALEAAAALTKDSSVQLVEILDTHFGRPMTFDNEVSGVETLFSLNNIVSDPMNALVTADFVCYTSTSEESTSLVLAARGRVQVLLGEQSVLTLPPQHSPSSDMHHVHSDTFYDSLAEKGYQYTGSFRAISLLKRRLNTATGFLPSYPILDSASPFSLHPATLESAFESTLLAYCAPGDLDLWSVHGASSVRRISVNPLLYGAQPDGYVQVPFACQLESSAKDSIEGDVNILAEDGIHTWVQIEGFSLVPSSTAAPVNDRILFAETLWDVASPDAQKVQDSFIHTDLITACERVAYYYLQKVDAMAIPENMDVCLCPEYRQLLQFAEEVVTLNTKGKHPFARREWTNDTEAQILEILSQYPKSSHLKFLRSAGEALPTAIFGSSKIHNFVRSKSWSNSPLQAPVPALYVNLLASLAGQVAHRYGHMNILEIDSGNGNATEAILQKVGRYFSSYTHACNSVDDFQKNLKDCGSKVSSTMIELDQDLVEQGFADKSYDLVILSSPLHVISNTHHKLSVIRQVLRPGGHILVVYPTNSRQLRFALALGTQPYYWASNISLAQWNLSLRKSGFSGIDTITSDIEDTPWQPFSVFAAQAIDEQILSLRQPLIATSVPEIEELAIVGGQTLRTSKIVNDAEALLACHCKSITTIENSRLWTA
jgi:hybrid polyketide synthase/nonribosomal peptide synthetase ACE1